MSRRASAPVNLPEALRQIGPEIDGFKGRYRIEPVACKDHIRHAALQNGAAAHRYGGLVDLLDFSTLTGNSQCPSRYPPGIFFRSLLMFAPPAAAAVQHLGVRSKLQKLKSPPCHRTVPQVHHGDHDFPAKPHRLSGVLKNDILSHLRFHTFRIGQREGRLQNSAFPHRPAVLP